MIARGAVLLASFVLLGCRVTTPPSTSEPAPGPASEPEASPELQGEPGPEVSPEVSPEASPEPAEPPAEVTPTTSPSPVASNPALEVSALTPDSGPKLDGTEVTLRGRPEAKVTACTNSMPPSCWGTLMLRDVERRKSYPVELQGSYGGQPISCRFPAEPPPPAKTKPKAKAHAIVSAGPQGSCTPDLDPEMIYEVKGILRFTGGGFTIEPTLIVPAPPIQP